VQTDGRRRRVGRHGIVNVELNLVATLHYTHAPRLTCLRFVVTDVNGIRVRTAPLPVYRPDHRSSPTPTYGRLGRSHLPDFHGIPHTLPAASCYIGHSGRRLGRVVALLSTTTTCPVPPRFLPHPPCRVDIPPAGQVWVELVGLRSTRSNLATSGAGPPYHYRTDLRHKVHNGTQYGQYLNTRIRRSVA